MFDDIRATVLSWAQRYEQEVGILGWAAFRATLDDAIHQRLDVDIPVGKRFGVPAQHFPTGHEPLSFTPTDQAHIREFHKLL